MSTFSFVLCCLLTYLLTVPYLGVVGQNTFTISQKSMGKVDTCSVVGSEMCILELNAQSCCGENYVMTTSLTLCDATESLDQTVFFNAQGGVMISKRPDVCKEGEVYITGTIAGGCIKDTTTFPYKVTYTEGAVCGSGLCPDCHKYQQPAF